MDGVWRAWLASALVALGPVSVVAVFGSGASFFAGLVLTVLMAAAPGVLALQGVLESERFLQGMKDACGRVIVTEDKLDWSLRRRISVETPVGAWSITGTLNPFGKGIEVTPPGSTDAYSIARDPAKTGRSLMAHLLTAQPLTEHVDNESGDAAMEPASEPRPPL
jgi:hypothetical protein